MEADGAVDAQNAPTAPWKTLCVFHELPQGLSHQVTHEKLRKAPKYRWETRIDPYKTKYRVANWPTYNQALVRRGDVTVWLSSEAIATWTPRRSGRRGGQRRYLDLAVG